MNNIINNIHFEKLDTFKFDDVFEHKNNRIEFLNNLRIVLTGRDNSPNLINFMKTIGKENTLHRISK